MSTFAGHAKRSAFLPRLQKWSLLVRMQCLKNAEPYLTLQFSRIDDNSQRWCTKGRCSVQWHLQEYLLSIYLQGKVAIPFEFWTAWKSCMVSCACNWRESVEILWQVPSGTRNSTVSCSVCNQQQCSWPYLRLWQFTVISYFVVYAGVWWRSLPHRQWDKL